ncbi:MAG: glycerol-3-phosphate responsive antiterminator [Clostridia bacterium]|nr:glycerol-3-phosphate responsive antiterminator [Clostridia bacterium]
MNSSEPISRILERAPVIAAVRKASEISYLSVPENSTEIVFILHATLSDAKTQTTAAKAAGKLVFLHADLIEGLSPDTEAMRYLRQTTPADGIISTRSGVIRCAKDAGFLTVQRFFVVDSQAEETVLRTVSQTNPDCIELMPGLIFPVMKRLTKRLSQPMIAGGLIQTKEQILTLLSAGACGVSTSCRALWEA